MQVSSRPICKSTVLGLPGLLTLPNNNLVQTSAVQVCSACLYRVTPLSLAIATDVFLDMQRTDMLSADIIAREQEEDVWDGEPTKELDGTPPSPPHPSDDIDDSWCTCGKCNVSNPTLSSVEKLCCRSDPQSEAFSQLPNPPMMPQLETPPACVSCCGRIQFVCLDRLFLDSQRRVYQATVGNDIPGSRNEQLRYIAYRQYVSLVHGHLGMHVRVVIPSCVTKLIRDAFPAPPERGYRGHREYYQQ